MMRRTSSCVLLAAAAAASLSATPSCAAAAAAAYVATTTTTTPIQGVRTTSKLSNPLFLVVEPSSQILPQTRSRTRQFAGFESSSSSSLSLCAHKKQSALEKEEEEDDDTVWKRLDKAGRAAFGAGLLAAFFALHVTFSLPTVVNAENELSAKYGGAGLDTSLVDQTCLVHHCSVQAKACLQEDPSCRKGLTCTAKCLGDNACITGCMARYGDQQLDNLLKCTIEDHDCIKVAILDGGADTYGQEPPAPAPTVPNFDPKSLQGSWYKVVGFNPNYDCYACQRNSFTISANSDSKGSDTTVKVGNLLLASNKNNNNHHVTKLNMDVEFSMPHLLPDGQSPPPLSNLKELIRVKEDGTAFGSQSIGLNDYSTRETMIFDTATADTSKDNHHPFVLKKKKGTGQEVSYARTAHSEGEMFGLKFWENWYVIGENDPGQSEEFKFIYYNGKTRQNTYEGAFVYSRTKELSPHAMKQVYQMAHDAGMNPNQFCRIRNGCFSDDSDTLVSEPTSGLGSPSNPFRSILASTRVSQWLGVEPVAARDTIRRRVPTAKVLEPQPAESEYSNSANSGGGTSSSTSSRPWWYEVGDYLENPHRHFQAMDQLRLSVDWPEDFVVVNQGEK